VLKVPNVKALDKTQLCRAIEKASKKSKNAAPSPSPNKSATPSPKKRTNENIYNYIEQLGGQASPPKSPRRQAYERGLAGGFKMNMVRKRHMQSAYNGLMQGPVRR